MARDVLSLLRATRNYIEAIEQGRGTVNSAHADYGKLQGELAAMLTTLSEVALVPCNGVKCPEGYTCNQYGHCVPIT